MRGFIAGSLILIGLQVFVSGKGPDKAAGLLGWTATALEHAISPNIAAIPQTKTKATTTSKATATSATVPGSSTGLSAIQA